jgi:cytoskeletal protein CcmA (bactofilin family)
VAFFGEKKKSAGVPAPTASRTAAPGTPPPTPRTVLGRGATFEGILKGEGEVVVEGSFQGEVNLSGSFAVGVEGRVEASIQARAVTVEGTVVGNVTVSERVDIRATGVIEGDITTPRVAVAEGATIRGRINMSPSLGAEARPGGAASPSMATPPGRSAAGPGGGAGLPSTSGRAVVD